MNKKLNVILFKTNDSKNLSKDRYIDALKSESDLIESVHQINLLSIELINVDILVEKLKLLFNTNNYKSLILTSKQTVEAIENALTKLDNEFNRQVKLLVYCVGDATSAKFNNLISKHKQLSQIEFEIIQTKTTNDEQHTQNAKQLSQLIIKNYKENQIEPADHEFYSFYPCSSIRKDDLSIELTQANINFDELKVYKTTHSETGLNAFNTLIRNNFTKEKIVCLVFFSPSSVEAFSSLTFSLTDNVKLISIGPSTTKSLANFNLKSFELTSPSPQSLLNVLKSL